MRKRARGFRPALLALASLLASAAWADTGPCGTNTGGALPDLIVNSSKLAQFLSVGEEKFQNAACSVQEGFVSGPGWRTLMRFTTSTPNVGAGALVIGDPAACPALFKPSSCHGHLHMDDYSAYRLWTPSGYDTWVALRDLNQPASTGSNAAMLAQALRDKSLITGRKMGFCMVDTDPYLAGASPTPRFVSCIGPQGISAGWADSYSAQLDGQSVEVDGLRAGDYVLEVHVNPELRLPETNYSNNTAAVRLRYTPRRGSMPPSLQILP